MLILMQNVTSKAATKPPFFFVSSIHLDIFTIIITAVFIYYSLNFCNPNKKLPIYYMLV